MSPDSSLTAFRGRKELRAWDYDEGGPEWGSLDILEACGASDPDSNSGSGTASLQKAACRMGGGNVSRTKIWESLENKLALAFSIPVLIVEIAYWAAAIEVSSGGCCVNWPCSPPAHFLPWPWAPYVCVEVEAPLSPIDSSICFLAVTGAFILVIIAEVWLAAWIGKRLGQWIERKRAQGES